MRLVLSGALEDCRIPDCDTCEAVRSETTTVVTPLGERVERESIESAQRSLCVSDCGLRGRGRRVLDENVLPMRH